uniref:Gustatory receptor n=1 Tax=Meteorus pulchricornis TaxID=51522 RepID=A0A346TLL7_9HYME|nr:gustatory receptor [Meteorus pulchricornis]
MKISWANPRDIIKASWPSLCISSAVGLRPFEVCRKKIVSYLYIITILTCYYGLFYVSFDYCDKLFISLEIICKSTKIRRFQMILNIFILPIMVISSASTSYQLKNSLLHIHNFDKKLEMFNVKLNYKENMREEAVHVFGIMIITILMGLMEYYSYTYAGTTYMYDLMWITMQFPQIVNSVIISTFVIMLGKIRKRHGIINNLIVDLKYLKKNEVRTIISAEIDNVFKLKLLREMYEICDNVATRVNAAYGITLLMSIVIFVIAICAHIGVVHATFGSQIDTVDFIVDTIWAFFYFGKFVYVADACHSYRAEGKRASELLHKCQVDANCHLLKQENESFARHVSYSNIRIKACDFFTIDYSLIVKVVVALSIYVFFLSQFSCTQ